VRQKTLELKENVRSFVNDDVLSLIKENVFCDGVELQADAMLK
jgi:hypothetical protein